MWVYNASPEINAQSDYPLILGVSIPLAALMLVIVCLRLYVRLVMLKRPGIDDWCVVAAAVRICLFPPDHPLNFVTTVLQYYL
jgi:hypothetical protein